MINIYRIQTWPDRTHFQEQPDNRIAIVISSSLNSLFSHLIKHLNKLVQLKELQIKLRSFKIKLQLKRLQLISCINPKYYDV